MQTGSNDDVKTVAQDFLRYRKQEDDRPQQPQQGAPRIERMPSRRAQQTDKQD